ncbi:MAG: hypothetical protein KF832_14150 [Caldilineaceae bacterium]|nr:hypothetical protein [Caldilineaceae bacterium]
MTATRSRQAEIAQTLAGVQVLTSTYGLGEYLRTLVQDALVLYNLVLKTEELFDVETQIAHLFNERSANRCLRLWAALHRRVVMSAPNSCARSVAIWNMALSITLG